MVQRYRPGSIVFGIAVGLLVAFFSYRWATETGDSSTRMLEEQVVSRSRVLLQETLQISELETVDPLAPQRKVGKVYIYPAASGWEVSGFYRRDGKDPWHPYLMKLDGNAGLLNLKVQDSSTSVAQIAAANPALNVVR
jgi:hypothetical protein